MRYWFAISLVFLIACAEDAEPDNVPVRDYNDPSFLLFMDSSKHIMGWSIGDSISEFDGRTDAELSEEAFHWELPFIVQDTSTRIIDCKFYDGTVYDIQVKVTTQSDWRASQYYADLLEHFNTVFHSDKLSETYNTWTFDQDNKTIEIGLTNESAMHDYGKITLTYYVR